MFYKNEICIYPSPVAALMLVNERVSMMLTLIAGQGFCGVKSISFGTFKSSHNEDR